MVGLWVCRSLGLWSVWPEEAAYCPIRPVVTDSLTH